jgi:hypothetical protein
MSPHPDDRSGSDREAVTVMSGLAQSKLAEAKLLASIAVSLKRIADALDGTLARLVAEEPPGGLGR